MTYRELCHRVSPIERVQSSDLSPQEFQERYFKQAKPVIITNGTDDWPARQWTIESLMARVGDNEVFVRCQTNKAEYQVGKRYTIRKETFRSYCEDLLASNARAKGSYLAVASIQQSFPQLKDELPLPKYLHVNGKIHLGPYLWVAHEGHYEFCHFDPDDNFLVMIRGRKRVLLFGHDLDNMYPNPLGSHGKTVQSEVNCDNPDPSRIPKFTQATCQECILEPGEMLFIPAFFWHQVKALDSGISANIFYGDAGENQYLGKILKAPYRPHFEYWLLNVIEQNRKCDSFDRILARLPEVLFNFFKKQFHDEATPQQIEQVISFIKTYLKLDALPCNTCDNAKFPPNLKIRGLLHRDDTKL